MISVLSMLRSIVINYLEKSFCINEENTAIIFAYCRYNARYSLPDILASFVKQLAQCHSGVLSLVKTLYTNHCWDGASPPQEELLEILRIFIPSFNEVYIIIDALDEFDDDARDDFLKSLISLEARLLVTSRPSVVSHVLDDALSIEIGDENGKDIELFIDRKFEESTRLTTLLRRKEQTSSQIRAKLKETSKSM